jgi:hypothetical protein
VIVSGVVFMIPNECNGLKRCNKNGMRICIRKSMDATKSKKVRSRQYTHFAGFERKRSRSFRLIED